MGIKATGHDTGAAIVGDEKSGLSVVAIAEARLNRVKHSWRYPALSIRYCLDAFGLKSLDEVDVIAVDWHTGGLENVKFMNRSPPSLGGDCFHVLNFALHYGLKVPDTKLMWISHLAAHAASAYFLSPFDEAATLIVDGGLGIFQTNGLSMMPIDLDGYRETMLDRRQLAPANYKSPGYLYEYVTVRMGFSDFDAGKTMALASYAGQFGQEDIFSVTEARHQSTLINHAATVDDINSQVPFFDRKSHPQGADGLVTHQWVNFARQAQSILEEDILFLAREASRKTKSRNLCLAGGVALSCVTNRKLHDSGQFDGMFIQPAASDEGIALGCALAAYYGRGGKRRTVMDRAYLGRSHPDSDVRAVLTSAQVPHSSTSAADVAQLVADGKIIGRCVGESEYGPRALGNRSILADPRRANMVERLNREIKHREGFRPFAPSCLYERRGDYFDMPMEGPFMIMAAHTRPEAIQLVPAVTHVDGSCRPQTVRREQNPEYHELIDAFGDLTGVYCLVNTSFNDNGEPIVESPEDAVITFLNTKLDHLLVGNFIVSRPSGDTSFLARKLAASRDRRINQEYRDLWRRLCDLQKVKNALSAVPLHDRRKAIDHIGAVPSLAGLL